MESQVKRSKLLEASVVALSVTSYVLLAQLPAVASLFVSNLGTRQVSLYADNGSLIESNFLTGGSGGGGGEGIACILNVAGVPTLFVANNTNTISTYNAVTGAYIGKFATAVSQSFSALSLSPDGSILYAAGNADYIYGFSTSDPNPSKNPIYISSPPVAAWHDVAVDPNGSVYATQGINTAKVGIYKISTPAIFVASLEQPPAPPPRGDYTGMVFDSDGDLWVTNFHTNLTNNTTQPGIYEFDPSGGLITSITSSLFHNPVGLAINPTDNNVYVANLLDDNVLKITVDKSNPANNTIAVFITLPKTSWPKYLEFTNNCCTAAVPGPMPLLGVAAAFGYSRKLRKRIKSSANPVPIGYAI